MTTYDHFYQHIASGATVDTWLTQSRHTGRLSVVDTCGNIHRITFLHRNISGTTAIRAFVLDHLTGTLTVGTGLYITHSTEERLLGKYHLTLTTTLGTGLRAGSGLRTGAVTGLTGFLYRKIDLFLAAENCLFKSDMNTGTDVGTFHGAVISGTSASAAAKDISENISENVSKISSIEIETTGTSCATVKCRMAILIILTSLLGITQHGISLGSFFKFLFCLLVSGVHVGMVFFRQYPVCFFNCSIICILIYTEDLVIVSLLLCHFCTSVI